MKEPKPSNFRLNFAWWKRLSGGRQTAAVGAGLYLFFWLVDRTATLVWEKILERQSAPMFETLGTILADRLVIGIAVMGAAVVIVPPALRACRQILAKSYAMIAGAHQAMNSPSFNREQRIRLGVEGIELFKDFLRESEKRRAEPYIELPASTGDVLKDRANFKAMCDQTALRSMNHHQYMMRTYSDRVSQLVRDLKALGYLDPREISGWHVNTLALEQAATTIGGASRKLLRENKALNRIDPEFANADRYKRLD